MVPIVEIPTETNCMQFTVDKGFERDEAGYEPSHATLAIKLNGNQLVNPKFASYADESELKPK